MSVTVMRLSLAIPLTSLLPVDSSMSTLSLLEVMWKGRGMERIRQLQVNIASDIIICSHAIYKLAIIIAEQFYHLSIAPRGQQNVKENGSLSHVTLTLDIDYGGQVCNCIVYNLKLLTV